MAILAVKELSNLKEILIYVVQMIIHKGIIDNCE